nr:immunoglobulin light chain junction region [Macaca mulatta]MOW27303.1 immunoglobulin light chain junction region [Macaca mulatta]MOW27306.1 immunoglobulin light chain junction region [Macaca mulatta]MOW27352.1 immunoglobulin light chain junction region [Macaca mulatta]MOW27433.1 immunoglobulin light chain junction region [Macaca mulatta]
DYYCSSWDSLSGGLF